MTQTFIIPEEEDNRADFADEFIGKGEADIHTKIETLSLTDKYISEMERLGYQMNLVKCPGQKHMAYWFTHLKKSLSDKTLKYIIIAEGKDAN